MRKLIIGLIMALALLGAPAAATAATDPVREPVPDEDVLPPGGVLPPNRCGFPIGVAVVRNNEYRVVTTLPDGTTITKITGNLVLSFTNEDTGKTIVRNVSGPTTRTTSPDGSSSTFRGRGLNWLSFGPISQANTGEPGLVFTSGLVTVTSVVENGVGFAKTFSLNGTQENGCALLS